MDSQHRHELQQNELGKLTHQAMPFFEKYGMKLVIGVAVAVGLVGFGVWWYSESSISTAESWAQLDQALHKPTASADDFASVKDDHPGTPAAAWAQLKAAEDYLKSGLQAAFTDRDASLADLNKALEGFRKLEGGGPGVSPEIRERALFGLARCLESTSDGETDEAIKVYSRLSTDFPNGVFKSIAQDRIKELEKPDAKEFYAWFHQLKPAPKDPHPFPIKRPSDSEPDDNESMELNDDAADSNGEKPASSETPSDAAGEESSLEKPKEDKLGEEKPSDEKPAEEQPSTDKPETTEKPPETPGDPEAP